MDVVTRVQDWFNLRLQLQFDPASFVKFLLLRAFLPPKFVNGFGSQHILSSRLSRVLVSLIIRTPYEWIEIDVVCRAFVDRHKFSRSEKWTGSALAVQIQDTPFKRINKRISIDLLAILCVIHNECSGN
jgi:hypothetical protein